MLHVDRQGVIVDKRIVKAIRPAIERGPMNVVKGLIVHQTGRATVHACGQERRQSRPADNPVTPETRVLTRSYFCNFNWVNVKRYNTPHAQALSRASAPRRAPVGLSVRRVSRGRSP